jgi:hypothetical protein
MGGAGKRSAPPTPRGSKTAHADILIIFGGRGGGDGGENRPIGDAVIGVSDRLPCSRRSR